MDLPRAKSWVTQYDRRQFSRQAAIGVISGIMLMVLILVPLFALGVREWNHRLPVDLEGKLLLGFKSLLTGVGVALVEETFFRGAVQGTLTKAGSVRTAMFAVPVMYAAIHFFGEAVRVPYEQVTHGSGFIILAGFMRKFAHPTQIADAFLACTSLASCWRWSATTPGTLPAASACMPASLPWS